jgi:Tol biopolymer transport system component
MSRWLRLPHSSGPRREWLALVLMLLAGGAHATEWDIADTGQPGQSVEFALSEGTWMSVDVSPDGQTLLFDLLGDVYRMSATGGDATPVHVGPAMQRSPSFSPDGRSILYLSDQSGADNLWISDVDGRNARQVTHETVDVLTGPAWGPNGETLSAAKIESTFERMQASEIRLFDRAGGAGRVLIETPANGRDVQEARYTPDGRYVYYTERLTDPEIFVDPHAINYAIKRRNLASGETETVVSGFGGATSPQISPDGRRVAFVRRVMTRTVLFVYDIETREQRAIYDALDRDAQADFVPHGAYYPGQGHAAADQHGQRREYHDPVSCALAAPDHGCRSPATRHLTRPCRRAYRSAARTVARPQVDRVHGTRQSLGPAGARWSAAPVDDDDGVRIGAFLLERRPSARLRGVGRRARQHDPHDETGRRGLAYRRDDAGHRAAALVLARRNTDRLPHPAGRQGHGRLPRAAGRVLGGCRRRRESLRHRG